MIGKRVKSIPPIRRKEINLKDILFSLQEAEENQKRCNR
jgi:hypothetical protein